MHTTRAARAVAQSSQPVEPSTNTSLTPSTSSEPATTTDPAPTKTLAEKAKELWATAKYLFKFYFNGVKQIWANRTSVNLIQSRISSGGSPLTREESQLIRTHASDMRKLPLFLFILLILEEALPLVVIWAPSLLPSTCILPNQLVKIRMGEEVKRAEAWRALKGSEGLQPLLPVVEESQGGASLREAHREGGDVLKGLSAEDLAKLGKVFSLSTWGGAAMVRRRLDAHLAYLRSDDALMSSDGAYAIPQHVDALAKACGERGLRSTGIDHREMYESLCTWLRYTTRNPETKTLSDTSLALLPLQLYNDVALQEVKSEIEAESARGLIAKTKDVLREVVEEEKKVVGREEKSKEEVRRKEQQQKQ
uniref:Letm1 RBD domain-containing protein n=1 Tax=Kalmanozyma brasiliensis (strain GHG001) TaxID=1365824 RepID=V5GGX4_KALBG